MNELVFTPGALIELLSEIEELKDVELSLSESDDGLILQVGQSKYSIADSSANIVYVDDSVIQDVTDIKESAYDELESEGQFNIEDNQAIESGIIKELIKTLFLGGVVRLSAKALKN